MENLEAYEEVPKYKKKSKKKSTKKSKHKHLTEPCIFSYPADWWTKGHLRSPNRQETIGSYCPICGKIGDLKDRSKWYEKETVFIGNYQMTESVLTKEGKREMNLSTRTLPCFEIDDPFAKFVDIGIND